MILTGKHYSIYFHRLLRTNNLSSYISQLLIKYPREFGWAGSSHTFNFCFSRNLDPSSKSAPLLIGKDSDPAESYNAGIMTIPVKLSTYDIELQFSTDHKGWEGQCRLLGVPSRRGVSLSESDSDVKKRLPMINQRQDLCYRDSEDSQLLSTLLGQQSLLGVQPLRGRLEEDVKKRRFENQHSEIVQGPDLSNSDRPQALAVDFASHLPKSEEANDIQELQKQNLPSTTPTSVFGNSSSFNGRELWTEGKAKVATTFYKH